MPFSGQAAAVTTQASIARITLKQDLNNNRTLTQARVDCQSAMHIQQDLKQELTALLESIVYDHDMQHFNSSSCKWLRAVHTKEVDKM